MAASQFERDSWSEPAAKRPRTSGSFSGRSRDFYIAETDSDHEHHHDKSSLIDKERSIVIASSFKHAGMSVAPFLARHIPEQYNPLGKEDPAKTSTRKNPNSKFCYRHRPDLKCRRQADDTSMEQLQSDLETLPQEDRQGIAHVWSLFSAAPSKHRNLMLQGILAQCCFPQLSYLSANVKELIRIDFLSALPAEISYKVLSFLDTTSLCKAAQVSQRWRQLADDDVVWHKMCEQHIHRKCTKCGWGLPLLERKRLRQTKREIQLRAVGRGLDEIVPDAKTGPEEGASTLNDCSGPAAKPQEVSGYDASDAALSLSHKRPAPIHSDSEYFRQTRPWKDVYKDRFKVGTNWKYGRYKLNIFKGHSNGVMCLQFLDNILATGSYDATIKLWDLETGNEIRTLRGHQKGIRCLQFDDSKLISGSLDHTIRVWNWRTGECISTFRGHEGGVVGLHFDGNLLASGSVDQKIKIWDFQDKTKFSLCGHREWVNSVKIDTPSRTLFSASDDCTVKLWDLDTRSVIRTYDGHVGQVQQVLPLPREFELDEEELNLAAEQSDDAASPQSTSTELPPVLQRVTSTSSSYSHPDPATTPPDSNRELPPKYMLTGALDNTIRLWETTTGRCIRTYWGHVEGVWALAADNLRVISGAEDGMVKVWDPRTGKCDMTLTGHRGPVTCVALGDWGLASGGEDGEIRVYSFKST